MSSTKDFFDLAAKDNNVKIELGTETIKALTALLAENGLKDDARKAIEEVTAKVAKAHGFDLNALEELSKDELEAVAVVFGAVGNVFMLSMISDDINHSINNNQ